MPAISLANQQGLAAVTTDNRRVLLYCNDTIPSQRDKQESLSVQKQVTIIKKVPKSRRQVKPIKLPGVPLKPVIKPKIIKPVVKL